VTDAEFRERFIVHLVERLRSVCDPLPINTAEDIYEDCPRSEMLDSLRDDPETAADESFVEYEDSLRDDDDSGDIYEADEDDLGDDDDYDDDYDYDQGW
jgi:hypothetical protein